MVVVYWLVASSAESETTGATSEPSARPESLLVLLAFVLYAAWDFVALQIRRDVAYIQRPEREDVPGRRHVTWVFVVLAAVVALIAPRVGDTAGAIYFLDVLLIVLLIGFRLAKEFVTPVHSGLTRRERAYQRRQEQGDAPDSGGESNAPPTAGDGD